MAGTVPSTWEGTERELLKGRGLLDDVRVFLPGFATRVILDVGANVGQSAAEFAAAFPQAEIHCFEPVAGTFAELSARFEGQELVHCSCCALGAERGEATIAVHRGSTLSALMTGPVPDGVPTEQVEISTVDAVCAERGIAHVDILKVDTEGHDLDVLFGAQGMLERKTVALVTVEAGMNPENGLHVPFETLKAHLESVGYRLFGIYEQKEEWPTLEPHLRRTNPAFISPHVIDAYRGHAPQPEA